MTNTESGWKQSLETLQTHGFPLAGFAAGRYRLLESGQVEKRCSACRDYWPADPEFFLASNSADGLCSQCKACYTARRRRQQAGRKR